MLSEKSKKKGRTGHDWTWGKCSMAGAQAEPWNLGSSHQRPGPPYQGAYDS